MRHLAVFSGPFLELILSGSKTIESRFSKVRCAPFESVKPGDIVLMKRSGGPVVGEFTVGKVMTWRDMTGEDLAAIAVSYGSAIAADAVPHFWEDREDCRYATLLYVQNPIRYERPLYIPKRDRRAWVVLDQT